MIKTFKCPSCGATMSYEGGPETTITCAFCGSVAPVPPELRAQAQPDPVHGFATHTPHPHQPAASRRILPNWQGLNPNVRAWVIILISIFVVPNCVGVAFGVLVFVAGFVVTLVSALADIFFAR